MQNKFSDTYCYYAMQSFSSHPHGRSRPCCFSKVHTTTYMDGTDLQKYPAYKKDPNKFNKVDNITDFLNDPKLVEIRKDLLNGKRHEACNDCWKLEDNGIKSFRQIQNEIHELDKGFVKDDGTVYAQTVSYLDISLGNVCNLKCRSCNPWNSHGWLEEGKFLPSTDWDETAYIVGEMSCKKPWFVKAFNEGFFDAVLRHTKVINFLGGEPLVVKEHYDWLEHIVANGWSKNIELHYNTNATTIPQRLLDIWDKFSGIVLALSIDATEDLAYYVRYPSKWKVIEKNMTKLANFSKNRKGIKVHTHVTLSLLNLHDLPNVLKWCEHQYNTWGYEDKWGVHGYQNLLPHFNFVEWPRHLNICNLPIKQKNKANIMLDNLYDYYNALSLKEWERPAIENIKGIKNILNKSAHDGDWEIFKQNTIASDKFRNLNIKDYISWMEEYI